MTAALLLKDILLSLVAGLLVILAYRLRVVEREAMGVTQAQHEARTAKERATKLEDDYEYWYERSHEWRERCRLIGEDCQKERHKRETAVKALRRELKRKTEIREMAIRAALKVAELERERIDA